jgi:hypothetical protein
MSQDSTYQNIMMVYWDSWGGRGKEYSEGREIQGQIHTENIWLN